MRNGVRPAVLETVDLEVRYGEHVALAPVSFTQSPGTVLAVTGPSGAGKTSLLWGLCRAAQPALGTVLVDGRRLEHHVEALAAGVSLIPQGNGLARVLTAQENVVVPLVARNRAASVDSRHRAETALTAVGLEESGTHLVEELSGGQQQRVAVARGIAQQATVLLADEPTSELDASNRDRVLAVLRAEADRGATVVIATNDLEVAELCDAHASLHEGALDWVRPF